MTVFKLNVPSSRVTLATRPEFLKIAREMLNEMEEDHEEHTGLSDQDEMPVDEWLDELKTLFDNTR